MFPYTHWDTRRSWQSQRLMQRCNEQAHKSLNKHADPLELIRLLMKFDYEVPAVKARVWMFAFQFEQYPPLTWLKMWLHHRASMTLLMHAWVCFKVSVWVTICKLWSDSKAAACNEIEVHCWHSDLPSQSVALPLLVCLWQRTFVCEQVTVCMQLFFWIHWHKHIKASGKVSLSSHAVSH